MSKMKKVIISDITLKKISEDRAVSLLFREKSAIANCAEKIGVDVIELPAVKSPREDKIIYKTIAQNVQNTILAIPVGFSSDDVAVAWDCIKDADKPRLQIELPVSTIQMEYTYHVKQAKMHFLQARFLMLLMLVAHRLIQKSSLTTQKSMQALKICYQASTTMLMKATTQ